MEINETHEQRKTTTERPRKHYTRPNSKQITYEWQNKRKENLVKFKIDTNNNTSDFNIPFEMGEMNEAIKIMKNMKAAGIDGIMTKQIKQLGPEAKKWLHVQ